MPDKQVTCEGDLEAVKSVYLKSIELRNFEINQLAQRNNFFMIFQGVLLASLFQSSVSIPIVSFVVCIVGMFVSVFQIFTAAGAKYWQVRWEAAVEKSEAHLIELLSTNLLDSKNLYVLFPGNKAYIQDLVKSNLRYAGNGVINWIILRKFSVSRAPIYVGILLVIAWFILLMCTMRAYPPLEIPSFIVGFPKNH